MSAFTRVFDALWSRDRSRLLRLERSRLCGAPLRKSYALYRVREKRGGLTLKMLPEAVVIAVALWHFRPVIRNQTLADLNS